MKLRTKIVVIAFAMVLGIGAFAAVAVVPSQRAAQQINLSAGWNLIGWSQPAQDIGSALGPIATDITVVWGFDSTNQTWHAYFPAAASIPGANDLTQFAPPNGYFIYASAAVVWSVGGAATATPTTSPTTTPPVSNTFGPGQKLVGTDITAGTYRTRQPSSGCYWERLSGLTGDISDIIANDFTSGPAVVTIAPTDVAFNSTDCSLWTTDLSAITLSPTAAFPGDGTYIVGVDIAPGLWQSSAPSGCYWARLSDFSGELSAILANDNPTGPTTVQILTSDKGFQTVGCGTWTKVG